MNDAWGGPTGEPLKGRVFFKELNPVSVSGYSVVAESPKKSISDLSKPFCSVTSNWPGSPEHGGSSQRCLLATTAERERRQGLHGGLNTV